MSGREAVRSAAFALALVLLCAVCTAAPGFAEEAQPIPPDEALESPQAEAEREASELAYADLSTGEEEQLLREQFGTQLEAIDSDPARVLDELTLERIDSPTEALVNLGGETLLLEAEVPLRAREEDGDLHKVELGLEESDGGYEPANPLVDLTLPASSDEPIEIGDRGLSVRAVGADDTSASPIGDEDLFLPAVHEDTSLLLSPIARGVEVSALLASRNSPEQLAFELTLPDGGSLRASDEGGAEVVDGEGGVLATVSAPHAVDAQGTEVPVTLRTEGDRFYLEIAHRQMDVAYPLFVDPEITEDWSGFADTSKLSYWKWSWSGVGSEDYIGKTSCIVTCWGNGLYVRSRSSFSYPKGSWGRWWFVPQGSSTYMYRVIVGPMNYDAHGCTANEPHPYVGVWNDSGAWKVLSNAYPSGWGNYIDTGGQNLGPGTRTAFVGIEAASGANISCGHDYRLGGAMLFLEDQEKPTLGTVSGFPTGWVKSGASFTISAPVSDPGLGVYSATLSPKDALPVEKKQGCDGHYANPCPAAYTFQFPIGAASFDEGEKVVKVSATDARDKPTSTYEWMMKVDRTPPEIGVSGQFAEATDETEGDAKDDRDKALIFPTYNLTVNATDGRVGTVANPVLPAEKRSGVKKIEVFVDQGTTPVQTWEATSCAAGNCPLSKTFTVKLNELSADADHYLRILARDFAGNAPAERKLEFEYIPATGMKEEYVQQYFPLPDGSGNEAEEEHPQRPELVVNLLSGNLVYRQQDAEVEGPGADLGVELFYNSLLPKSQNTEWGDGWTMAQAPELEIEEAGAPGPPTEATIVEESGSVESSIDLPTSTGEESFDKTLQATVTKEAGGGYEVADESGETDSAYVFDASGQVEEARTGTAATVDYDSNAGGLSQISVEDPATANVDPKTIDEGEVFPNPAITHSANFGSYGSADGQFKTAADAVADPQGNLWVLDRGNGRIQKFNLDGQFVSKFGSPGSAEGKIESAGAIALDAAGNVLVAESGRVQKFSPQGQLLAKFGSWGSGEGQINLTNGITVGIDGSVWVSDLASVQRFTAGGQFIERVGASGTGAIVGPQSLDTAPNGDVVVADAEADKIKVFNKEGDFVRQFGSAGSGPGQFMNATEVDVDADGNIWVADSQADRVELFNADGDFIAQFGSLGTGTQQFQLNNFTGLAADGRGRVWVADTENSRVDEWLGGNFQPATEPPVTEDDPQLDVDVSEGLVDSVEGEEVGTIDYAHSGDLLTSVTAPDGKASFTYDSAGRMTKVTLPNGTYGEIAYEATYGRVKSVTVAVEGKNAKTTYFAYYDEPRRTIVTPSDAPATTYDIAADGSIFKWWNAKSPPVFTDIAGTLYDPNNRETSAPIATGAHNLLVQAHDDEGLASIQIVANNDQLVDEKTCEYPSEPSKCVSMVNEWVTETGNWPPGILYLEVIATDRLGEASSQRFWVNIPYTPPPDPEAEEPPRFSDILNFREEFGLDLDLKGDEIAINDRIFDLMGAWHNPTTPDGEVARATAGSWGVPLRSSDAAELGYREAYSDQASRAIPDWVASQNLGSAYAGYYMDHRQGGLIYVGFTGSQSQRLAALQSGGGLSAADRLRPFPSQPAYSLDYLKSLQLSVVDAAEALPSTVFGGVEVDIRQNQLQVGAANVAEVDSFLDSHFGASAPIAVHYEPLSERPQYSRIKATPTGPLKSAEMLGSLVPWAPKPANAGYVEEECSVGWGAWDVGGVKDDGSPLYRHFVTTAGHCFTPGTEVLQWEPPPKGGAYLWERKIGYVRRYAHIKHESNFGTDAEAIRVEDPGIVPRLIRLGDDQFRRTTGSTTVHEGQIVCRAGQYNPVVKCGAVEWPPKCERWGEINENGDPVLCTLRTEIPIAPGSSGGPYWEQGTGKAVGTLTGGIAGASWFTPVEEIPGYPKAPGSLQALGVDGEPLHLVKAK